MGHIDIVKAQLQIDEGKRRKPYVDTRGRMTIGIGRNLTDKGLSAAEINILFDNDVAEAELGARAIFHTFDQLTENRKAVLVNMVFNMGASVFSGFHATIVAVESGDFSGAAERMLQSRWASQVGDRAKRLADLMKSG